MNKLNKYLGMLIISIGISFLVVSSIIESENLNSLYNIIPIVIVLLILGSGDGASEIMITGALIIIFVNLNLYLLSSNQDVVITDVYATSVVEKNDTIISFIDIDTKKSIKVISIPTEGFEKRIEKLLKTEELSERIIYEPFQSISKKYNYR